MSYIQGPASALDQWVVTVTSTGAANCTTVKAAAAGVQHVARRVMASVGLSTTAFTPTQLILIDGTSAASATGQLLQWSVGNAATVANGAPYIIDVDNIHLPNAVVSTAMAVILVLGVTAVNMSVNLIGYDLGVKPKQLPAFVS